MHFRTTAVINFAGILVYVIVCIVLGLAGWHYWALVWGAVMHSVALTAGAWLMCRWIPSRPGRVPGTGSGLKFAMTVYSHFAFGYVTRNTDNLLVGLAVWRPALDFTRGRSTCSFCQKRNCWRRCPLWVVSTLSRGQSRSRTIPTILLAVISGPGVSRDGELERILL